MRLFARAAIRAGLPLRYTRGFNPQPRVLLPLPRPVGVAADGEVLILELTSDPGTAEVVGRLGAQLPAGLEIRSGSFLNGDRLPQARSATYEVDLSGRRPPDLAARIEALFEQDQVFVDRRRADGTRVKAVDIRPHVLELRQTGERLIMRLGNDERGSVRAEELLRALGLETETLAHQIRRLSAEWTPPLPPREPG